MKTKSKKIVIGNMKMHGSLDFNESHFKSLRQKLSLFNELAITLCVPYPYLFQAQKILMGSNIHWGCQNVAKELDCLLYTSPSPRDKHRSRMPSSA